MPAKDKAPLVVVPPPPKAELPGATPLRNSRARGSVHSIRGSSKARDPRGTASREEIRRRHPDERRPDRDRRAAVGSRAGG